MKSIKIQFDESQQLDYDTSYIYNFWERINSELG